MRDKFWGVYHSIAFKKYYYLAHQRRSETWLFWARVVCLVVSVGSVLIWGIAKSMPVLWACLIALAQLAQSMIGYLPWARQLNALHYLLPELNMLLVDIEEDWLRLAYADEDDDEALAACASKYSRAFCALEQKYTNGVWFPLIKNVCSAAESTLDNYLRVRYPEWKGDEKDESKESDVKAGPEIGVKAGAEADVKAGAKTDAEANVKAEHQPSDACRQRAGAEDETTCTS